MAIDGRPQPAGGQIGEGPGWSLTVYVPDIARKLEAGYTGVEIRSNSESGGDGVLAANLLLRAGEERYTYRKADGKPTDWAKWRFTPNGQFSEWQRVGPYGVDRRTIRRDVGRRARMMRWPVAEATGATPATLTIPSLLDADASPSKFARWFARRPDGQVRRVRSAANKGFAPDTGVLTLNPFPDATAANTEIELWKPRTDEDPSELLNESMNVARTRLWIEDAFYFTVENNVSVYAMPFELQASVKRVEVAAGTYPEMPRWYPVQHYELTKERGQVLLEMYGSIASDIGINYGDGIIVRVLYNYFPQRMVDDDSVWPVSREWAAAEVGVHFLEDLGVSHGDEDVNDVARALTFYREQREEERKTWMPSSGAEIQYV